MKGVIKKILIIMLIFSLILIPACQEKKPAEKATKPAEKASEATKPEAKEEQKPGEAAGEEGWALGCG